MSKIILTIPILVVIFISSCSNIEITNFEECIAAGETNQEVIDKMFAHAGEVHKDKVEGMSEEDKAGMVTKMNETLDKQ